MTRRTASVEHPADAAAWRGEARRLLAAGVAPEDVVWEIGGGASGTADDLFAAQAREAAPVPDVASAAPSRVPGAVVAPRVPRAFTALADQVACHRDGRRYALLYRTLWRLTHGEPGLLGNRADADVDTLERWAKAVRRDAHKMTAFVRFRRVGANEDDEGFERYAAWFEPEHRICRHVAPFFTRRFANMGFSIFTPDESLHWDTATLAFGPGATAGSVPKDEAMEALWLEYYANIFNPSRLKLDAMRAEMPVKYWKNLPEAPLIRRLVADAGHRSGAMVEAPGTRAPRFAVRAGLARAPDAVPSEQVDGSTPPDARGNPDASAEGGAAD